MNATPTATEAIVEKIQKLLNMTTENGCTESEAANAALLASKLLTQHKLEMSDVLKTAFKNGDVKAVQGTGAATDKVSTSWANGIAIAVGKLSYCKAYAIKDGFAFVGFAEDVQVASALMDHFILHAAAVMNQYRDRDWTKFKKAKPGVRYNGGKVRGEFMTGYGQAVSKRLNEAIQDRELEAQIQAANVARAYKNQTEGATLELTGPEGVDPMTTTTSYEIVKFSEDAIKAWEKAEKEAGHRFEKQKKAYARTGAATTAGYAAGQRAPLNTQSHLN